MLNALWWMDTILCWLATGGVLTSAYLLTKKKRVGCLYGILGSSFWIIHFGVIEPLASAIFLNACFVLINIFGWFRWNNIQELAKPNIEDLSSKPVMKLTGNDWNWELDSKALESIVFNPETYKCTHDICCHTLSNKAAEYRVNKMVAEAEEKREREAKEFRKQVYEDLKKEFEKPNNPHNLDWIGTIKLEGKQNDFNG